MLGRSVSLVVKWRNEEIWYANLYGLWGYRYKFISQGVYIDDGNLFRLIVTHASTRNKSNVSCVVQLSFVMFEFGPLYKEINYSVLDVFLVLYACGLKPAYKEFEHELQVKDNHPQ